MISKSVVKYIHSLEQKKFRREHHTFVAEGPKVVGDLIKKMKPQLVVATAEWLKKQAADLSCDSYEVTAEELRKVSFLQHPQEVLAVFEMPVLQQGLYEVADMEHSLCLALDGVQDPGNLGTIIRIADWFGIEKIFCSLDTADCYNPKVVQATMGSLARVQLVYTDLLLLIDKLPTDYPVYATLLDGNNLYEQELSEHGLIVMGNEGNGVSDEVRKKVNRRIFIPNYPEGRETAESLNVAIATAVTCAEFRRPK